jgi:sugar/nucleoside kinase (ribokinase family)
MALLYVGKYFAKENKPVVFNIGGPNVINKFYAHMMSMVELTDYVICNEEEAGMIAKT